LPLAEQGGGVYRPVKSGPKIGKKREKTEKNELENEEIEKK